MPDITQAQTPGSLSAPELSKIVKTARVFNESGGSGIQIERHQATEADREAILQSLYEERQRLTRAKRLSQASANDEEYLAELNDYIDEWEAAEARATEDESIWAKLDELAAAAVSMQYQRQPK